MQSDWLVGKQYLMFTFEHISHFNFNFLCIPWLSFYLMCLPEWVVKLKKLKYIPIASIKHMKTPIPYKWNFNKRHNSLYIM